MIGLKKNNFISRGHGNTAEACLNYKGKNPSPAAEILDLENSAVRVHFFKNLRHRMGAGEGTNN